jgi:hypothetical protein
MEYEIINSYTIRALEDMVTARLKNGWQCQGGIGVVRCKNGAYMQEFFQAMIKITNKGTPI